MISIARAIAYTERFIKASLALDNNLSLFSSAGLRLPLVISAEDSSTYSILGKS
jgi:hypothetical protein